MAINELRSISIFATAAELGSLRKTAAALNISPQAASQALAQLEQHLDVRLFHRTTRSMALTDEGRRFLEEAQPSLVGLRRALQSARQAKDEIAGPLHIVGPRSTFQPVIWRLVDEFCQQYPGIVPDVQLEDRVGNWVEDRVDVGFRLGLSPHEGVIARRLLPAQLVIRSAIAPLQRVPASKYGSDRALARQGWGRRSRAARGAGHLHQRRDPGAPCSAGRARAGPARRRDGSALHSREAAGATAGGPRLGSSQLLRLLRQPQCTTGKVPRVHRACSQKVDGQHRLLPEREGTPFCLEEESSRQCGGRVIAK